MMHLLLLKACYVVWPFGLLFVAWFGCYGIVLAVWIWKKCSSAQFSCVGAMASWDVQDLLKEIADMEVISMRNHSSDLLLFIAIMFSMWLLMPPEEGSWLVPEDLATS